MTRKDIQRLDAAILVVLLLVIAGLIVWLTQ